MSLVKCRFHDDLDSFYHSAWHHAEDSVCVWMSPEPRSVSSCKSNYIPYIYEQTYLYVSYCLKRTCEFCTDGHGAQTACPLRLLLWLIFQRGDFPNHFNKINYLFNYLLWRKNNSIKHHCSLFFRDFLDPTRRIEMIRWPARWPSSSLCILHTSRCNKL